MYFGVILGGSGGTLGAQFNELPAVP
jgi:hypothetical protein